MLVVVRQPVSVIVEHLAGVGSMKYRKYCLSDTFSDTQLKESFTKSN